MSNVVNKCICQNCGCVNIVEFVDKHDPENWLNCVLPTGFEWALPAGKISPVVGSPIYVSAFGEHLSYDAYLAKYQIDPEIAYTRTRAQLGKNKKEPIVLGSH